MKFNIRKSRLSHHAWICFCISAIYKELVDSPRKVLMFDDGLE